MKLVLGCGKKQYPREEGWTNIDKSPTVGADIVMDLFSYPWNLPADSVDEVLSEHLVEHIPHEPKISTMPMEETVRLARWDELKDYDGFFCFFGELWRVCKNGARVRLTVPFGFTYGAFQDPTHIRYMVPQSFAYLTAEMIDGKDFDYDIPCLYTVKEVKFDIMKEWIDKQDVFGATVPHVWNITRNMYVDLEVIKDGNPHPARPKINGTHKILKGS